VNTLETRTCPTCGETFAPTRGRRFCSPRCWPSRRPFADPDAGPDGPATYAELIGLLWTAARRGSVSAMAVLLKETKDRLGEVPPSVIDELAKRRG
jgi:hypothetical protein